MVKDYRGNEFNWDFPWDHPENMAVVKRYNQLFASPYVSQEGMTTYKAIILPIDYESKLRTVFSDGHRMRFSDVLDGTANTLMIVEDIENPIPWNEPADLSPDEFMNLYRSANSPLGGMLILTVDGQTHFIEYGHEDSVTGMLYCSDGLGPNIASER